MSAVTPIESQNQATVEIRNVSKGYGDEWERLQVIEDISLTLAPGELTAIVGPSGCGKSTLVNLVAGFEQVDSGSIELNGVRVRGPSRERMVVFQETALLPWLTTYQNIAFGPRIRRDKGKAEIQREIQALLEKVGLSEFRNKYPLQLSGGMQRRAELARAIMNEPLLMIMDEPFRGLDAMTRELMQQFFAEILEETGRTSLFVTSEIEEAILLADRVVVLSNLPVTIREIIEVDLPRPREIQMLNSERAYGYKKQAMEILHEEAMKNFKGAETRIMATYDGPSSHHA